MRGRYEQKRSQPMCTRCLYLYNYRHYHLRKSPLIYRLQIYNYNLTYYSMEDSASFYKKRGES